MNTIGKVNTLIIVFKVLDGIKNRKAINTKGIAAKYAAKAMSSLNP
jgi:hypothetical protein